MDLAKFFDTVNHDRLISMLERNCRDKMLIRLIRRYLRTGILADGLVTPRDEGTPQGSPLSPILSLIVLDELDKYLEKRGLKFCRYPKSRSKRSRYSSENDVLIEKSVKYTDFFLLSIVYV